MNLFRLHPEKRIGYKKLSDADLGMSSTSHQTHFGLFGDILTFLPDKIEIKDAIFIYGDVCEDVDVAFGRIQNPDGSYRSPKVSTGADADRSLLRLIRNKASNAPLSASWFLFWFGLANGQPVFYLLNSLSPDFHKLLSMGLPLTVDNPKGRIYSDDILFDEVLFFIESKINKIRFNDGRLLELASQGHDVTRKFRPEDYIAAQQKFVEVGRHGEILVDHYLNELLVEGRIHSYKWMNKEGESFSPYDFEYIPKARSKTRYIEVKTTGYNFDQLMFFSSQEITFADDHISEYNIYRVYRNIDDSYSMRISEDDLDLIHALCEQYFIFKTSSAPYGIVTLAKLEIDPNNDMIRFGEDIELQNI